MGILFITCQGRRIDDSLTSLKITIPNDIISIHQEANSGFGSESNPGASLKRFAEWHKCVVVSCIINEEEAK
jgi:hypothetical protein